MKYYSFLLLVLCFGITSCKEENKPEGKGVSKEKLTSYVNTFTGTDGPGLEWCN